MSRLHATLASAVLGLAAWFSPVAAVQAQTTPDALIRQLSTEVIDTVKSDKAIQAGDVKKIIALVDAKILPHVNFQRMTALSVGPSWRQATPEQRGRLQDEFKLLLVRTYAGALTQIRDQSVIVAPFNGKPEDTDAVVQTQIKKGREEGVKLDYRLERAGDAWKIYDVNVLGFWLVQSFRSDFAQQINATGIDGLISKLAERNKSAAAATKG